MKQQNSYLFEHIAYTSHKEIDAICKPLQQYLKIDFFCYQRDVVDHANGLQLSLSPLCNDPKFMEFAVSHRNTEPAVYNVNAKPQLYLMEHFFPKYTAAVRNHLGIKHYFCRQITVNHAEREVFAFGTYDADPRLINFYFNNVDLIDNFILYFRDKAAKLLQQTWDNKIISNYPAIYLADTKLINEPNTRKAFLQATTPRHYLLHDRAGVSVKVTVAEMGCLQLLARGRTAKEIALELSISPRTVETYLDRAKNRLSCYTRRQLLDLLE